MIAVAAQLRPKAAAIRCCPSGLSQLAGPYIVPISQPLPSMSMVVGRPRLRETWPYIDYHGLRDVFVIRYALGAIALEAVQRLITPEPVNGQTVVIEDYLQVRPERRAALERLVTAGRLKIQPLQPGAAYLALRSGVPIVPVEQTRTCSALTPSAPAARRHVSSAARRPCEPVAEFAQPLFKMTPTPKPPVSARWARETCTGAAAWRFEVNVAATGTGRAPSLVTSARSSRPSGLIPAAVAEATKPRGDKTVTAPGPGWAARESPPGRVPRSPPGSPVPRPL